MNLNNKVYSITTTYNPDIILLQRQLESLNTQVDKILLVDNGSNNIEEISNLITKNNSLCNSVLLINESNMGLGFAQNRGINVAKGELATHVLLLDQDSVLDIDFTKHLLDSEKQLKVEGHKVGAVGPIYFNEVTGEVYPITKYRGPFIDRLMPGIIPVEATFLIASGCLINIDALNHIGLMNEELFIDYIDVDWSFRAKKAGYSVFACPSAKMMHTIGDNRASIFGRSISVHSPLRRYYLYRNSIYMVKDPSINTGYKVREIAFNLFRFTIFLFLSKERKKYFKYSLAGFSDGFKGIKGKCPYNF